MKTPLDMVAFLRDFEFVIDRTSKDEVEAVAGELKSSVTARLKMYPASAAMLDRHTKVVVERRLEKLNGKAEADAGSERAKAGTATKRG